MKDIPGIDENGNPKNGGFDDEEQKHGRWKRYYTNGRSL